MVESKFFNSGNSALNTGQKNALHLNRYNLYQLTAYCSLATVFLLLADYAQLVERPHKPGFSLWK